jgi:hypothetical protein
MQRTLRDYLILTLKGGLIDPDKRSLIQYVRKEVCCSILTDPIVVVGFYGAISLINLYSPPFP